MQLGNAPATKLAPRPGHLSAPLMQELLALGRRPSATTSSPEFMGKKMSCLLSERCSLKKLHFGVQEGSALLQQVIYFGQALPAKENWHCVRSIAALPALGGTGHRTEAKPKNPQPCFISPGTPSPARCPGPCSPLWPECPRTPAAQPAFPQHPAPHAAATPPHLRGQPGSPTASLPSVP